MSLTRRRRPIRKTVPEMAAAARTDLFHTDHSIASVAHPPNVGFAIGLEKSWAIPCWSRISHSTGREVTHKSGLSYTNDRGSAKVLAYDDRAVRTVKVEW